MLLVLALIFLACAGYEPLGLVAGLFCLGLWLAVRAMKDEEGW